MKLRHILLVVALVAGSADASTFCSRWSRVDDPSLKRVAMAENLKQLDASKVDKQCLADGLDGFVRWANRVCANPKVDEDTFSYELVKEARSRCP